jgi:hypothetical protein
VKSDIRLPLMYGAILLVLMLYRSVIWLRTAPYGRGSLNT